MLADFNLLAYCSLVPGSSDIGANNLRLSAFSLNRLSTDRILLIVQIYRERVTFSFSSIAPECRQHRHTRLTPYNIARPSHQTHICTISQLLEIVWFGSSGVYSLRPIHKHLSRARIYQSRWPEWVSDRCLTAERYFGLAMTNGKNTKELREKIKQKRKITFFRLAHGR